MKIDDVLTALHRISLASQNSMSSKEECGRIAREALAAVRAEREVLKDAVEDEKKPWGVEMRSGGWLSTEVMEAGSGTSVAIDKAHRFPTQVEAEQEASQWLLAGGMAKQLDEVAPTLRAVLEKKP